MIKKISALFTILFFAFNVHVYSEGPSDKNYVEGEVLVKYKKDKVDLKSVFAPVQTFVFRSRHNLSEIDESKSDNIKVYSGEKSTSQLVNELRSDSSVERVEPNYIRESFALNTNDVYKDYLWGLENSGQIVSGGYYPEVGTVGDDIKMQNAWNINEGTNQSVIIAVIDSTGIAYNHPDLLANMWDGTNCKDASGNFLGGCVHGYNYADNTKTPLPTDSNHGTHIAGVIAAIKNNNKGVVGVAPNVKIMAIRTDGWLFSNLLAIDFAIQNGAKVINASYGGSGFSQFEYDAIDSFRAAGGIFVAAAGNSASDNDNAPIYPSDYTLDNIISVAATDQNDDLASFSNYGDTSVDIGAPGTNIAGVYACANIYPDQFIEDDWVRGGTTTNNWLLDWGAAIADTNSVYAPYSANADTSIQHNASIPILPSNYLSAKLDFDIVCDTPVAPDLGDYIQTQHYSSGAWSNSEKYDENRIIADGGSYTTKAQYYTLEGSWFDAYYSHYSEDVSDHMTNDFKFGFKWITDSSTDSNYGCEVSNVTIVVCTDGADESYGYMHGTSIATPYVAGTVALIKGFNPALSYSQVRGVILSSGDPINALAGKVSTGKRLNAGAAMLLAVPPKTIDSFTILGNGTVSQGNKSIGVTVPSGTNVANLTPSITISGASVSPASGVAQNFASLVTYTVTATDGTTQPYIVTVSVAPSSVSSVSSSVYTVSGNNISNIPYGTPYVTFIGNIAKDESHEVWDTGNISITVVNGNTLKSTAEDGVTFTLYNLLVNPDPDLALVAADKAALVESMIRGANSDLANVTVALNNPLPSAGTNGSSIAWSSDLTQYISNDGQTVNRPTYGQGNASVNMTATLTKGSVTDTKIFSTTVIQGLNPAKSITDFGFASPLTLGTINQSTKSIDLDVPYGTVVTALVPTIIYAGASISPNTGVAQNFTNPISYNVTAEDGTTVIYTATVHVAKNPAKSITSFNFASPATTGVIDEFNLTITLDVPFNPTYIFTPTITITGESVSPASGIAQDFASSVNYTVTAENTTTQTYVVTVNMAPDPNIAAVAADKAALSEDAIRGANTSLANIIVGLTNPLPLSGSSGSTIAWASSNTSAVSNDGQTINRPSYGAGNVALTLTATLTKGAVTDTKVFTITVLETPNPAKAITKFNFDSPSTMGYINEIAKTILVYVPYGTALTSLSPIITTTGALLAPDSGVSNNFTAPVNYTVTAADMTTQIYAVTVLVAAQGQAVLDTSGSVSLNNTNPQAFLYSPVQNANITVASDTTTPTVNLALFTSSNQTSNIPPITINYSGGNISFSSGTNITSSLATWDGIIYTPVNTSITFPDEYGYIKTQKTAIETGIWNGKLSFNNGVRMKFSGQGGNNAGYQTYNSGYTEISNSCGSDSQDSGNSLSANSECKLTSGSDLIIWTKHFTKFGVYSKTNATWNMPSAPTCRDSKPSLAPHLLNVERGYNSAKLTWVRAGDPVTYYLIAYGLSSGSMEYGNPNIGGVDAISYTVNGLSANTTYYFRIRAGNGCTPGDFSNELASVPYGQNIPKPTIAIGFSKESLTPTKSPSRPADSFSTLKDYQASKLSTTPTANSAASNFVDFSSDLKTTGSPTKIPDTGSTSDPSGLIKIVVLALILLGVGFTLWKMKDGDGVKKDKYKDKDIYY